jgi:hypothetical protein
VVFFDRTDKMNLTGRHERVELRPTHKSDLINEIRSLSMTSRAAVVCLMVAGLLIALFLGYEFFTL